MSEIKQAHVSPEDILNEKALANWLGIPESEVAKLKTLGMPFIPLGRGKVVFRASSVASWAANREKNYQDGDSE